MRSVQYFALPTFKPIVSIVKIGIVIKKIEKIIYLDTTGKLLNNEIFHMMATFDT